MKDAENKLYFQQTISKRMDKPSMQNYPTLEVVRLSHSRIILGFKELVLL